MNKNAHLCKPSVAKQWKSSKQAAFFASKASPRNTFTIGLTASSSRAASKIMSHLATSSGSAGTSAGTSAAQ